MKPAIKKRWVKALRSGEYKQGKLQLRRPDKNAYCCLGVLCEVMGVRYKAGSSIPQRKTLSAAGLDDTTTARLANMNDDGRTFKEIATYIEASL